MRHNYTHTKTHTHTYTHTHKHTHKHTHACMHACRHTPHLLRGRTRREQFLTDTAACLPLRDKSTQHLRLASELDGSMTSGCSTSFSNKRDGVSADFDGDICPDPTMMKFCSDFFNHMTFTLMVLGRLPCPASVSLPAWAYFFMSSLVITAGSVCS